MPAAHRIDFTMSSSWRRPINSVKALKIQYMPAVSVRLPYIRVNYTLIHSEAGYSSYDPACDGGDLQQVGGSTA